MKLSVLAAELGAILDPGRLSAEKAAELEITGVSGIESAGSHQVSFLANPKYAPLARTTEAAALLVEPGFTVLAVPTLRLANPYLGFARALEFFHPAPVRPPGVHPTAVIDQTATLGARAHVGAYAVVGPRCRLGEDAVLLAHVVLYEDVTVGDRFLAHAHAVVREGCILGDDVVLQNGAVVGSDGFGFAKNAEGRWHKIFQSGPAVLEDAVEIQANACIDRASIGETRIARGTKIDNLVQVGHGSRVGENTLLCAQVGLAGSTVVGRDVILAGQVGVAGHLTVGDRVVATAQSGIPSDVPPGTVVSGYPAVENRTWLRNVAAAARLPEILKRLKELERRG